MFKGKPPPSATENPTVDELRLEVEGLKRALKAMSRDLDDAIDGFYRRRQSDKMREIREEDLAKKPKRLSERDVLLAAVNKTNDVQKE